MAIGHDEYASIKPRTSVVPSPPSKQEAEEHSIMHIPYRSGYPFCVTGKAKTSPDHRAPGNEVLCVPGVACDDCLFMSTDAAGDLTGDQTHKHVKILVAHDSRSRCCGDIAVPQQGVDPEEYATRGGPVI